MANAIGPTLATVLQVGKDISATNLIVENVFMALAQISMG
jgi:hypothetical protein